MHIAVLILLLWNQVQRLNVLRLIKNIWNKRKGVSKWSFVQKNIRLLKYIQFTCFCIHQYHCSWVSSPICQITVVINLTIKFYLFESRWMLELVTECQWWLFFRNYGILMLIHWTWSLMNSTYYQNVSSDGCRQLLSVTAHWFVETEVEPFMYIN